TGKQPHEMERTLTAHYCAFNVQQWMNLAHIAERCGVNLWGAGQNNKGRPAIRRAVEWLLPYIEDDTWPYEQLKPFNTSRWLPIVHFYQEKYGVSVSSSTMKPLRQCDSVFDPHDGIAPYWLLAFGEKS